MSQPITRHRPRLSPDETGKGKKKIHKDVSVFIISCTVCFHLLLVGFRFLFVFISCQFVFVFCCTAASRFQFFFSWFIFVFWCSPFQLVFDWFLFLLQWFSISVGLFSLSVGFLQLSVAQFVSCSIFSVLSFSEPFSFCCSFLFLSLVLLPLMSTFSVAVLALRCSLVC